MILLIILLCNKRIRVHKIIQIWRIKSYKKNLKLRKKNLKHGKFHLQNWYQNKSNRIGN